MVEPNQRVSEMTFEELKAMLGVCYSLYLGIDLEEKQYEQQVETLVNECFVYHHLLYVWKLRELFLFFTNGVLEGVSEKDVAIHSLFIYKMKKAYFDNRDTVRQKMQQISRTRY